MHKKVKTTRISSRARAWALLGMLTTCLVAGCGEKAPTCSDEATVRLVKGIYQDGVTAVLAAAPDSQGAKAAVEASTSVELRSIRTTGRVEGVRRVECEATLAVRVPPAVARAIGTPGHLLAVAFSQLSITANGDSLEKEVRYQAQITDDGKQIHVQGRGIAEVGQAIATLAASGALTSPQQGSPGKATPESSTSPTVAAPSSSGAPATPPAPVAAGQPDVITQTRHGALSVTAERQVLLKDAPLKPPLVGDGPIALIGKYEMGPNDAVLLQQTGGTGCPALYYFVQVTAAGGVPSKAFGTCSDTPEVSQEGGRLLITMPQAGAEAATRTYTFIDGAVSEVPAGTASPGK